ncbi:transposase, Ptta/En/Spm, transposase, Tnp1/En/Spm-like protein [Tanacetum coccineum]
MAAHGGRNNIVARRVIDDLIDISGERSPPKYLKIFIEQQITDHRRFIALGNCVSGFVQVKSVAAKMAHSKTVYPHTMGQGGYALIEKKEIEPDEEPARGTLWLKGRVNKDEEYPDDEIRSVGDKLKETKDKIKEGTLKVDHGTDAMTIVLGKEKGGYERGVGSGVTYKRYFDLPQSRQASDERILLLQSQLDNERCERQEKELLIQNLSNKMSQTEGMVTKLKNQLAAQGGQFQSMSTRLTPPNVSPVDINPINSSADEEGGTTVVRCENDASIQKSNGLATLEKEMETRETVKSVGSKKMTRSIRKDSSRQDSQSEENVSPLLVLPQTDGKQMLYNKQLPKECYEVSIDTSLVDAACILDVGNNGFETVKDAVGGFFAWPNDQVVFDPKRISHVRLPKLVLMLALEGFPSSSVRLFVSLGCSGNTTRIMRRTLKIFTSLSHSVDKLSSIMDKCPSETFG